MIYRVGFVAAFLVLAAILWSAKSPKNNFETTADDVASFEIDSTFSEPDDRPRGDSADRTIDAENHERQPLADDAPGLFGRVSPAEIQSAVYQRLAEQAGLKFVNIDSVSCDMRACEIVFSGTDANPQYVDDYSGLLDTMTGMPSNDFRTTSGSIATREISPGAREYVLGFTYVALVDASTDPETAARQHAVCAGAWARVTEQRGSDDYIRRAHEQSAEWLEMSAKFLGLEQAQLLADELRYGPQTRDCHAAPY